MHNQLDPDNPDCAEDTAYPADPESDYGWEKLFAERLYSAFNRNRGIDVRIARYHNIFGPMGAWNNGREKAPAAVCRKVAEAPEGGSVEIWGDGQQTRSFLYIDDCLEGTFKLMESDFREPLNIGSDRLVTIDELADIIIKISGKKLTKKYNTSAPQGVRGRNADLTLVKKILGWEPKISLEKGLAKTYRWIEEMVQKRK